MSLTPVQILNQLLAIHLRSLPVYLASARPWTPSPDSPALTTLCHIAKDQLVMADRIGKVIMEQDGMIASSEFPMQFTDLHDLSIDFLIPQVKARLERELEFIRRCVEELQAYPAPRAIAEEAAGAALAHLDNLRDLTKPNLQVTG
jgi:hypothetical protein